MGGGKKRRQRGPRALSPTVRLERRTLWTMNAVPGTSVYGESLRRFSGQEHRRWDPTRSKLGAGMLRTKTDPERLLPPPGETVLYLGAGHGTSVSHLHDHLCGEQNRFGGRLVCVDLAPRCLRELTFMAAHRPGLVPVLGDARQHAAWGCCCPPRCRGSSKTLHRPVRLTCSSTPVSASSHRAAWGCSPSKRRANAGRGKGGCTVSKRGRTLGEFGLHPR